MRLPRNTAHAQPGCYATHWLASELHPPLVRHTATPRIIITVPSAAHSRILRPVALNIVNARSEYSGERIGRVKTSSLASYFCPVHRQTGAHSTYSSINRDPRKAPFARVPWTLSTVVISPLIPTFRTGSAASDLPVVVGGSLSQCICRPCNKKFLTEGLRPRKAGDHINYTSSLRK